MDCPLNSNSALAQMILPTFADGWSLLSQTTQAGAVSDSISGSQYLAIAITLAVLILPFVIGNWIAKSIKMPNMGTRFGWILLAITGSIVVLTNQLPGLGVDLRGGTILVYEVDQSKVRRSDEGIGQQITSEDLVEPLTRRINPSGTQEIVIRPYGETQIEIIVPEVNQQEVDRIKSLVEEAGILRFAILANRTDHEKEIELARAQAQSPDLAIRTSKTVRDATGRIVGFWANVDREANNGPLRVNVSNAILRNPDTGEIIELPPEVTGDGAEVKIAQWIDQNPDLKGIEALMIVDEMLDITGEDLAFATSTFDENGAPAVAFTLTDSGSGRFFALTTQYAPTGGRTRQLGIVLDDNLLSAPAIQSPIRKEGRITGRFTREEVERLVAILRAGQLPAALTKQPIAENQIDATLGADTIRKGVATIVVSLALVLLFILFYYRFSGFVACVALVMNLAMILATMVLINQPLTLPGLAGLVLTVGMSVDANVLIFERIREELKKGAAPRMAIRNGFSKATVTIVDANLTTLITAIVLYAIGTDQIRGFAVTLILGILYSMFTAIYVSRTIFDLAERRGFVSLSMSDAVSGVRKMFGGESGVDFIGAGKMTVTVSVLLMIIGVAALFMRGRSILDIDFAGGSSVQFRLDAPKPSDEVRAVLKPHMVNADGEELPYTVNGVSMEGIPEDTVYKVDSSFEQVDELKSAVVKAFEQESDVGLVTYQVKIQPADVESTSDDEEKTSRLNSSNENGVILTAAWTAQDTEAQQDNGDTEPNAAESDSTEPDSTEPDSTEPGDAADAQGQDAQEQDAATKPPTEGSAAGSTAGGTAAGGTAAGGSMPGASTSDAAANVGTVFSSAIIEFGIEGGGTASINAETLKDALVKSAEQVGISLNRRVIRLQPFGEGAEQWNTESSLTFSRWRVDLPIAAADADQILATLERSMNSDPVWISSSSVGSRVAGDMVGRAFGALFASLLCIIGYIWFRFQRVLYGFAAVAALVHDVLITVGAIAISYWLADVLGFLLIDPFKISLTVVAAILTIIGYSLNDTIVVFDRIRETKGKATKLTPEMINVSISQTLSRTLLTSLTTLIVVVLLYWFGGEGIHAFAFALVVGVIAGTYSSIFVASPILLWLIQRNDRAKLAS